MSEYRIRTDGEIFIVQKKMFWGLWWECPIEYGDSSSFAYYTFNTKEEAKNYLVKKRNADKKSKWKTV